MLQTALHFSHTLLKEVLQPGDIAVDATMGNGHDTVFMAELVGSFGHVFSFDIQEQAINETQKKVHAKQLKQQVTLFQEGHEKADYLLPQNQQIKAAIFNLGYLPKSDKTVITQAATTKQALHQLLQRLEKNGRIIIVSYYGHDGGLSELETVESYCQQLSQDLYNVLTYQFINQKNQPPKLFCIEKK